ncbi:hypothetical protein RVBP20_3260 [Pseudomonas phage sp. NK1]|nr:hypothetical protein RVBP20_3260 [Pseudomonas phage sp. NK1]
MSNSFKAGDKVVVNTDIVNSTGECGYDLTLCKAGTVVIIESVNGDHLLVYPSNSGPSNGFYVHLHQVNAQ